MPLIRAEIDLAAIAHNVRLLHRMTRRGTRFMAVVKANGYGHGGVQAAETALKNGADCLGVARIEEGIALRIAGISAPILVFGYAQPEHMTDLVAYNLTPTIFSLHMAENLSRAAKSRGEAIRAHVKIDTGMGRVGFLPERMDETSCRQSPFKGLIDDIAAIIRMPGLEIEGVFTHFACADVAGNTYTRQQFALFSEILSSMSRAGIDIPIKHAANSGALINHPETHLDMVRPGIALYGLYPSREVGKNRARLHPAMTLKATIVTVKTVPAHFKISYGCTYETNTETRIATIPVGYADGYNRLLSSCGHMLVHGKRAPVVGRVCMDLTMLDVGHIPGTRVGDEVVVFGRQGGAVLHVDEIAKATHTINYEVVTAISERVPRVYIDG